MRHWSRYILSQYFRNGDSCIKIGGKAAASWADLEVSSTDIRNDLAVRV